MNWRTVARMVVIKLLAWLDQPTTPARVTPDVFSPAERVEDGPILRPAATRAARGVKATKPVAPPRRRRPAR